MVETLKSWSKTAMEELLAIAGCVLQVRKGNGSEACIMMK
jgi:hypothetical protein